TPHKAQPTLTRRAPPPALRDQRWDSASSASRPLVLRGGSPAGASPPPKSFRIGFSDLARSLTLPGRISQHGSHMLPNSTASPGNHRAARSPRGSASLPPPPPH